MNESILGNGFVRVVSTSEIHSSKTRNDFRAGTYPPRGGLEK